MARGLKQYIISLKDENDIKPIIKELETWGLSIDYIYRRSMVGISLKMSGLLAKWYANDSRILSVEESYNYTVQTTQLNAPYHLDRIDQRDLPFSGNFTYSSNGTNIVAYVIDSGAIYRDSNARGFTHTEFGSRISPVNKLDNFGVPISGMAFDPFFDQLTPGDQRLQLPRGFDELGHGTHVAGLIGGSKYGVAKNITIKTAKVFGAKNGIVDETITNAATIIAAIEAILADWDLLGNIPALCNMSFSGPISNTLESSINFMINSGMAVIASAGNEGIDASFVSPARMTNVITVGSTDKNDNYAIFSNYGDSEDVLNIDTIFNTSNVASNFGSLVDLYAPGVEIISAFHESSTSVMKMSGTSMSAPIVSGICCLILEHSPTMTPALLKTEVVANASDGKIVNLPNTSNNKLAYSIFVDHNLSWVTPSGSLGIIPEGSAFNLQLESIGTVMNNLTYSLHNGTLPPGLSLSSTGLLNGTLGTVLSNTTYNFTIRVSNDLIFTDRSFSLTIQNSNLPPLWTSYNDLGEYDEGELFSIQLKAVSRNGNLAITYSMTPVLGFDWDISPSGLLTGRAPLVVNESQNYSFNVTASDGLSSQQQTFKIKIKQFYDFEIRQAPRWVTNYGKIGDITATLNSSIFVKAIDENESPNPVKYYLETIGQEDNSQFGPFGQLPDGITLNENTGEISGVWTGDLAGGEIIGRTRFDGNSTTFDGMSTNFETIGAVFKFAIFASDGANVVGRLFEINAYLAPSNKKPEWITPFGSLGDVVCLSQGIFKVEATDTDGPEPVKYILESGQVPPGMVFNSFTGEITGVPEFVLVDTYYILNITATDGNLGDTRTFSIRVLTTNVPPIWITPEGQLLEINEGADVQIPLKAIDNNFDTLKYTVISQPSPGTSFDNGTTLFDSILDFDSQSYGALPPGLSLNPSTGIISGLIQNVLIDTVYTFTIRVDDSLSNNTEDSFYVDREFSIKVLSGALDGNIGPTWFTPIGAIDPAYEGEHYYFKLQGNDPDNNPSPLSYILIAGSLPSGLTLNASTGVISGYPFDNNNTDDLHNFTVRLFDGIDSTDRNFSIQFYDQGEVNLPPVWQTPAGLLGNYNESSPMVYALYAIDPEEKEIEFSIISGSLPFGLTMTNNGIISGIPSQVLSDTTFSFTVRVEDDDGNYADRSFSIVIVDIPNVAPNWITASGALAVVNENSLVSIELEAIDPDSGPNPLTYSLTTGVLPPGLFLNTNTGVISGTTDPIVSTTTYNFTISVSDGLAIVPRAFSIVVQNVVAYVGPTTSLSIAMTGYLRDEWREWNSPALIPDEDIYQINDANFGRVGGSPYNPNNNAVFPNIFVKNGLHTNDPADVFDLFGIHHDDFELLIGLPTFAVVRNNFGVIQYEVIYYQIVDFQKGSDFDIIDTYENRSPAAPDITLPANTISRNFDHLRTELGTFANTENLPAWMTSEQIKDDPNSILGYTAGMVIAYVKPGTAKKHIDRLNKVTISEVTVPPPQTIFDDDTTIFDDDTTLFDVDFSTDIQITKGPGHQFIGRKISADRYLFSDSLGNTKWLKWKSDNKAPIWITNPGRIGVFYYNQAITPIQLETENTINATITYQLLSGSLPPGLTLNPSTGVISGTTSTLTEPEIFHISVRAKYANGWYSDRGFEIVVGLTTFDSDSTTFYWSDDPPVNTKDYEQNFY